MINPKIVPQKFSFEKPTITNGKGETISYGISVTINIDAFKADKTEIKKGLNSYFCWCSWILWLILSSALSDSDNFEKQKEKYIVHHNIITTTTITQPLTIKKFLKEWFIDGRK